MWYKFRPIPPSGFPETALTRLYARGRRRTRANDSIKLPTLHVGANYIRPIIVYNLYGYIRPICMDILGLLLVRLGYKVTVMDMVIFGKNENIAF